MVVDKIVECLRWSAYTFVPVNSSVMLKEFRKFIMTGNVIDLAVAVLLAGAVGLVVKGFVSDIMMPVVGFFTGGLDLSAWKIVLQAAVEENGEVVKPENAILVGNWLNSIINLIIVGWVLFMIVKGYNKMRKPKEEAPAPPSGPSDNDLLTEIRDLLKK